MIARLSYPLAAVLLATTVATVAYAQTKSGSNNTPSAFQGFARDNKEPVKIEANAFEVHDKDRYAIFTGNVVVQQGESTMRSRDMKVYYEGSQRIRRLEALGGVIITNKDQKASGDLGVLDMATNTATITGNVVLTQGPNVMRGDKLVVDLKTGFSRLESGSKDGNTRVQGLFVPSSVDTKKGTGTK
jgi:lipopolysaccharide export system protein LptA